VSSPGIFGADMDAFASISYLVPLGPGQSVGSHVLRSADETQVEGCGGTMAQPMPAPGLPRRADEGA